MAKKRKAEQLEAEVAENEEDAAAAAERKRLKREKKKKEAAALALAEAAAEEDAAERKRLKREKKKKEAAALALAEAAAEEDAAERKRLKREKKKKKAAALALAEAAAEEEAAERKRLKREKKTAKAAAAAEEARKAKAAVQEDSDPDEPFIVKSAAAHPILKNPLLFSAHAVAKEAAAKEASAETALEEGSPYTAFVGGLPSHVDEAMIKRDFGECGTITDVTLSRWPQDGSSKGIAFITYETLAALLECIKWNGEFYERKKLRVERKESADKDPNKKRNMGLGGQRGQKPDGCMSVALLDMSKQVTEDHIYSFLEECGAIAAVKILKHRETYESRGIAFVTFEETGSTNNAVKLSGKTLVDKSVRIEYAAPKNDVSGGKGIGKGSSKEGSNKRPEGCMSVVVRDLSTNATEDDLWNFFKSCQSISNCSVLKDRETWLSKGIAFVDFDDSDDTDKAVRLSGGQIHGKPVSVSYKVPKF